MSELGIALTANNSVIDTLNQYHIPEVFLGIVGLLMIIIGYCYLKHKDSSAYKLLVAIGVVAGVVMVILCLSSSLKGSLPTLLIVLVASFALIIRPFRNLKFAIVFALLVAALVFVSLGNLSGNLAFLSSIWPRVIIALVAGLIVYILLVLLQNLTLFFAKVFNLWPVLFILGIVCILEAVCVGMGYGSIINMIIGQMKT